MTTSWGSHEPLKVTFHNVMRLCVTVLARIGSHSHWNVRACTNSEYQALSSLVGGAWNEVKAGPPVAIPLYTVRVLCTIPICTYMWFTTLMDYWIPVCVMARFEVTPIPWGSHRSGHCQHQGSSSTYAWNISQFIYSNCSSWHRCTGMIT